MNTLFIVVWVITLTVPTSCPDYKPDPYTGEYPMMHCLVAHYKTITKNMRKEFKTKEEAQKFIDNASDDIRPTMKILEENHEDS